MDGRDTLPQFTLLMGQLLHSPVSSARDPSSLPLLTRAGDPCHSPHLFRMEKLFSRSPGQESSGQSLCPGWGIPPTASLSRADDPSQVSTALPVGDSSF